MICARGQGGKRDSAPGKSNHHPSLNRTQSHGTRVREGMKAASERRGARRRYSDALKVVRQFGAISCHAVLTSTRAQVELVVSDLARSLPVGRERDDILHLLNYSEAYRKFRSRNAAWVADQLSSPIEPGKQKKIPMRAGKRRATSGAGGAA